jgi:cellulose synthase/poly-beta-1,6-N-acetylglucosamine synthase-like glycosyltransferase
MKWPEPIASDSDRLTFSLIVPARHEADVIGNTLRQLMKQTHRDFEVVVSLCDDDLQTIEVVRGIIADFPQGVITLVTDTYENPSKPLQLNKALQSCAGEIVGVIDAEDDVAPGLLVHVEALFNESDAAVVQGGVQLMNLGSGLSKWFQVHNVLEYFFWFTSRMAYQSNAGFVPLGGNTVFIKRGLLNTAGGWPVSLTEDCALGVLLATRFGAKVATAYSAELVTREESPASIFNKDIGSLFWQRDRWIRGFLAEFMAGKWLHMPTLRQKILAGYILSTPFLQAISFLLLPFAFITAVAIKAPIGITMLTFTPVLPLGLTVLSQLAGLREFSQMYRERPSLWHYISVLMLAPAYQILLAAAAVVATYKYAAGDTTWYKTGRAAAHRPDQVDAGRALEGIST